MTKSAAASGAIVIIALLIGEVVMRGSASLQHVILHSLLSLILALALFTYCGFATLHAVQHVSDPAERAGWVILTVGFNIAGSCIYYFTKYQSFRKIRKGGLIRITEKPKRKLGELSDKEKEIEPCG